MSDLEPVVRHMLLCDDVQHDPSGPRKVNVFGLTNTIRSHASPPFPFYQPQLTIYLALTGGRGTGDVVIAGVQGDSDSLVFATPPYTISFGSNPLAVRGMIIRVQNCPFPDPGLYWIEFRYNGRTLARQPLLVEGPRP